MQLQKVLQINEQDEEISVFKIEVFTQPLVGTLHPREYSLKMKIVTLSKGTYFIISTLHFSGIVYSVLKSPSGHLCLFFPSCEQFWYALVFVNEW